MGQGENWGVVWGKTASGDAGELTSRPVVPMRAFGFTVETTQIVNHVWMPQDMGGLLHEAAAAKLDDYGVPFCKQHLTGKELTYIQKIFDSSCLTAHRSTPLCAPCASSC